MADTISLRFLVSAATAGSIIGKAGAVISEIEANSHARVQLSRPNELFPGTSNRILLLTGSLSEILTGLRLTTVASQGAEWHPGALVTHQLLAPHALCGSVLGKEGATIRAFTEDSGATIKVSSKQSMPAGVSDRVVTISGSTEQALRATALVASKLTEDSGYPSILRPYTYGHQSPATSPSGGHAGRERRERSHSVGPWPVPVCLGPVGQCALSALNGILTLSGPSTTLTLSVPDVCVGAILGRGGETKKELQRLSGATIQVATRGEKDCERQVTLKGTQEAVDLAKFVINQLIAQEQLEIGERRPSDDTQAGE